MVGYRWEKEIKNFVFNYTDGTSKTVEEKVSSVISKDEPNGESTLSFEFVGVSVRKDLTQIVLGCVEVWVHAWECSTKRKARK